MKERNRFLVHLSAATRGSTGTPWALSSPGAIHRVRHVQLSRGNAFGAFRSRARAIAPRTLGGKYVRAMHSVRAHQHITYKGSRII